MDKNITMGIKGKIEIMLDKEEADRRKDIEFMYSNRYSFIKKVASYLKVHKRINEDDILYFPEKFPFSLDEFHILFSLLKEFLEEEVLPLENDDIDFDNTSYFFNYDDISIEVFTMYGQGVCNIMSIVQDDKIKEIPSSLIGSFRDWLLYIEREFNLLQGDIT